MNQEAGRGEVLSILVKVSMAFWPGLALFLFFEGHVASAFCPKDPHS
jgi:hypothetical protein